MVLTKTDFLTGHQCAKALWFRKNGAALGVVPKALSTSAQLLVDQGQAVGALARQRFPGGVNLLGVAGFDLRCRADKTSRLIEDGADVLYEAVFIHDQTVCAVDVLVRDGGSDSGTPRLGAWHDSGSSH